MEIWDPDFYVFPFQVYESLSTELSYQISLRYLHVHGFLFPLCYFNFLCLLTLYSLTCGVRFY